MSLERATPEDHTREVERIHKLIEHIQTQALTLQKVAQGLPDEAAEVLSEKAEELIHTADEMLERLEQESP